MKSNSIEFIYKAMNAIASRKHDPEIEQSLADAIQEELLVLSAGQVIKGGCEIFPPMPEAEAHIA